MSSETSQGINLDTMSLEQLNSIKQQQQNRLEQLSTQYNALKDAKDRLSLAKESLSLIPTNEIVGGGGQEIMIPLTESLYAPGKIVDPDKILVELGAGFFVEKTTEDAVKVLDRKFKMVDKNSENIMSAIDVMSSNVQALNQAMQGKIMEIQTKQAGAAYKNQMEGNKQ
jgi:prefoldin alpha subunit